MVLSSLNTYKKATTNYLCILIIPIVLACGNAGDSVVSLKFQITDKKQELDLSDITILK